MVKKLRTLIDNLDDLPEELHEFYEAGRGDFEGRYVLAAEPVDGLELAPSGKLQSALDRERKSRRTQSSKASKMEEQLAELQEKLAAYEEAGENGQQPGDAALAKERKQLEAKLQSVQQSAQQQIEAVQGKAEQYRQRFRDGQVDRLINEALTQGEVRGPVKLMAPLFKQHVRWEEDDDGNDVMTLLDMDGETPLMKAGQQGTFNDLAQRYAQEQDFQEILRVPAASGGDARGKPGPAPRQGGPRQYRASLEEMQDFARFEQLQEMESKGEIELIPPEAGAQD